ncbi:hypothetical protein EV182_004991, partial [Spiromyces aspiralis]
TKLHSSIVGLRDEKYLESPFVVNFHRVDQLAESKSAWSFYHTGERMKLDLLDSNFNQHNERHCSLSFEIDQAAVVHGLAGYFSTTLYKDVTLCTLPEAHSPDMFSWFPMFFPLKDPITVVSGQTVVVNMWRRTTNTKVWYEWLVDVVTGTNESRVVASSGLHNLDGWSYWIGL